MTTVVVNGRYTLQKLTGVQRYAREIVRSWQHNFLDVSIASPGPVVSKAHLSHFWEQTVLPLQATGNSILWSPANSGPIHHPRHIVTVHDGAVLIHPEWFNRAYVEWRRRLLPRLVKSAKHVITISDFSKSILCEYCDISADDISVIHNGVDHSRFYPRNRDTFRVTLQKFNINEPYLLSVGSLEPRKNIPRLLEAWQRIAPHAGNVCFILVGECSSLFAYTGRLEERERVRFIGRVDDEDLASLYSGALIFIYPSLFEGFGLPPLEAMACGTPVLTSNTTALSELVGDAAITIDPFSVDAIQSGIELLLGNKPLRENLRRNGLDRSSVFNWTKTANLTWKIIQKF